MSQFDFQRSIPRTQSIQDHNSDINAVSNAWYYFQDYKRLVSKYPKAVGKFDNLAFLGLSDEEYLQAIQ